MKNFVYVVFFALLMYACANPVAPTGGNKDVSPPEVLLMQPNSGITNYQGDKIEFIFDEYIVYSSGLDKLLITPPMPEKPKIYVKGKKLIIKLPENLDENTTYNISFLGAIVDYNAGNSLNLLKHVFSTGDYIDSASISGVVKNAYNNKRVDKITVGLYAADDTSVLIKSKPTYLTQTDNSGNFRIENVKEGNYQIAAIEDKNLNFLFDQTNERISLPTNPIFISNNTFLEQELQLFHNESKVSIKDYKLLNNNSLYFYFSKEVETISLDIDPYSTNDVVRMNTFNDTLYYYWSNDSLKGAKFYFDINNGSLDTIDVNFAKNKRDSLLYLASKQIVLNEPLIVKSPLLISDIDIGKIQITDTLSNILDFTYKIENEKLLLYADFVLFENYNIKISPQAITNFNGSKNREEFFIDFNIKDKLDKSDLILTLNTENTSNLILELLNKSEQKIEQYDISNLSALKIEALNEGSYYIRIYSDLNNNAKWNTGSLENNYEAEPCLFYSPMIEIKTNWDKDFLINF